MSGLELKLTIDDVLFEGFNWWRTIKWYVGAPYRRRELARNAELKNHHAGSRVFVVGNGPSILKQDLRPLKEEVSFFVNRAFLLPQYEEIRPTYHIFIDQKLASGEWPLDFLHEAREKNPDVVFLLNASWRGMKRFAPFRDWNVYWVDFSLQFTRFTRRAIDLRRPNPGNAVVEVGVLCSVYMGAREVYMLGVDGNGLLHNLMGTDSHAYGSNAEDHGQSMWATANDLYMMSMSFRKWVYLARYCDRNGVRLVNSTPGSLVKVGEAASYESLFGRS